jgi:flagellar motility protein MotE (MotC chaperone)
MSAPLTYLDDESAIKILTPSPKQRFAQVLYEMTPARAAALADALEQLPEPEPRNHWRPEIDGLREAAQLGADR